MYNFNPLIGIRIFIAKKLALEINYLARKG